MKAIPTILTALAVPVLLAAQSGSVPNSYKDLNFPPLHQIQVPKVERFVLANGATIFLVEDQELPVVHAQAMIRTGDRYEPADKAGLADITLRVLRMGGTASNNGDALDKKLDRMAASVETFAGGNASTASMFVLKKDTVEGLTILADLLQHPAFPQDKIDLVKIDMRDTISRRNDSAHIIHGRETKRLLYGKTSPYVRRAEYATLDAIARPDLIAFHQQYFQPENSILGVWGDFNAGEMRALVEKTFGAWPKGGNPKPGVPAVDLSAQAKGLYLMKKEDINQSTIGVSLLVPRRDDPDYFPLAVMTDIFGGSFGSRMFNNIRSKAGLAYSASASFPVEYDHAGLWTAHVGTKSESTIQALKLVREEIARIRQAEVSDQELADSKDRLLKGEAFDYDSTGKIVGRLMTLEYYGYPSDYLKRWRAGIDKVTKADILRVAQKHLDDGRFLTTVLGNAPKFDQPLASLGAVTEIDYSIPPPKSAAVAAATGETAAKGEQLLARARRAHGGAALEKVNDFSQKLDLTVVTPQGEMTIQSEGTVSLSGRSVMKMVTPQGEMTRGFDGNTPWMKTAQGTQEMAAMAPQMKSAAGRETLSLLKNFDKPGFQAQALGMSKIDGIDVEGVLIKNESIQLEVKLFVDPKTGLLAGKSYIGRSMGGPPGEIVEAYSDIREVDGVKMPFRVVLTSGGKKTAEQKVSALKINPGVPDSAYQKPQ